MLYAAVLCVLYAGTAVLGAPYLKDVVLQIDNKDNKCTGEGGKCAQSYGTGNSTCCSPAYSCKSLGQSESTHGTAYEYCQMTEPTTYDAQQKTILLPGLYTADPAPFICNGKLYVITSHDIETEQNTGANKRADESQFDMKDYIIMGFSEDMSKVTNYGSVLPIESVPWVKSQMWAPDATCIGNTCYVYFPARDEDGLFRIGVATSNSPTGPFSPESTPIAGSYSIDPAVFVDDDGGAYLYFGGLMGGQLQWWQGGKLDRNGAIPTSGPALLPRGAKLKDNMKELDGDLQEMSIVDDQGVELGATDLRRRFFEGPWVHKHNGVYYLTYSVGEEHLLVYATSKSGPLGPWVYRDQILSPPVGWTSHGGIVEYNGHTYLFYHDSANSGETNLRNVKFQELIYRDDGSIVPMTP